MLIDITQILFYLSGIPYYLGRTHSVITVVSFISERVDFQILSFLEIYKKKILDIYDKLISAVYCVLITKETVDFTATLTLKRREHLPIRKCSIL